MQLELSSEFLFVPKALLQQDEHDDESAIFERAFGFGLPSDGGVLGAILVAFLAILLGVMTSSSMKLN